MSAEAKVRPVVDKSDLNKMVSEFDKAFKKISRIGIGVAATIGAAMIKATASFNAVIDNSRKYQQQLGDLNARASQFGLSPAIFQRMLSTVKVSGVDTNQALTAMTYFQRMINENDSLKNFRGQDFRKSFWSVITQAQDTDDPQLRYRLLNTAFGRGGAAVFAPLAVKDFNQTEVSRQFLGATGASFSRSAAEEGRITRARILGEERLGLEKQDYYSRYSERINAMSLAMQRRQFEREKELLRNFEENGDIALSAEEAQQNISKLMDKLVIMLAPAIENIAKITEWIAGLILKPQGGNQKSGIGQWWDSFRTENQLATRFGTPGARNIEIENARKRRIKNDSILKGGN